MVVPENEIIMSQGEVDSTMQTDQHQRNNVQQLGRQSSIYSLTLDEFQHTLNESGKNFGSMNMDEFLNSIWTAEENQAHAQVHPPATAGAVAANASSGGGAQFMIGMNTSAPDPDTNMIARQMSLSRQGSLALPGALSRKTVDEVWSEIQKTTTHQHENRQPSNVNNTGNDQVPGVPGAAERQATYGEMTLEDFLVKAGVVRESTSHPPPPPVQQAVSAPYGYQRVVPPPGPAHMVRPMMGIAPGGGGNVMQPAYAPHPGYPGGKRPGAYQPQPPPCYVGMVGNAAGVAGAYAHPLNHASPASPVSSDGIVTSQIDTGNQYMDMTGRGGRKRIIDGPVEKVVERRQRRMIKNRESAARSRARKQAYTVELEAELNMLKEENAQLKQALAEVERERKQQYFEEMRMNSVPEMVKERSLVLRRTSSCSI